MPREVELRQRVFELENQILLLRAELCLCQQKLSFWESHPTLATGVQGESLVAKWVNGLKTSNNKSIDVVAGGLRIEVKMSQGRNSAVKGRRTETRRWTWPQILGISGNKPFDSVILVGGKDQRFLDQYLAPTCPYIIFEIPYDDLVPNRYGLLMTNGNARDSIYLTTNPRTVKTHHSRLLFQKYQTTEATLASKYGMK